MPWWKIISHTFHYILFYNIYTEEGSARSLKLGYLSKKDPWNRTIWLQSSYMEFTQILGIKIIGQLLEEREKYGRGLIIYGEKLIANFLA